MLADYEDIIEAASEGIRERHREQHNEFSRTCEGWHANDCHCVEQPLWWDENGVPRYKPHHPKLCPDIYATEIALLRISCQSCDTEFEVQMSWSEHADLMSLVNAMRMIKSATGVSLHVGPRTISTATALSERVKDGSIHYGDPPRHGHGQGKINIGGTCSGDTMNCWDLKVMEFWRRGDKKIHDWNRVAELEIDLPDMQDEERRGA
jgi:hypothetical protein